MPTATLPGLHVTTAAPDSMWCLFAFHVNQAVKEHLQLLPIFQVPACVLYILPCQKNSSDNLKHGGQALYKLKLALLVLQR